MNKAVFYLKKNGETSEVWAKAINQKGELLNDVRLDNNSEYASVNDWKDYKFDSNSHFSEFSNELFHYYFMPIIYKFLRFQEVHNVQEIKFIGSYPDFYFAAGYFLEKKIKIEGLSLMRLKRSISFVTKACLYIKTQIITFGTICLKCIQNVVMASYKSEIKSDFALIHSKFTF